MSLARESSRFRGWGIPAISKAKSLFGGKSIFRTRQTEVKIKRVNGHEITFVALGKLDVPADVSADSILERIAHVFVSSRNEKSDFRIARHGKEPTMNVSQSFTCDNLPTLSEESLQHLADIKRRAAARKAKRELSHKTDFEPQQGLRKAVTIRSSRGKLISLS